ncbi:MAG: class II aldolase/adducin family protein [Paracoccaceae bacterium]
MSTPDEAVIRAEMVHESRRLAELGLNPGTSGNVSHRLGPKMLITPSAVPPHAMTPEMICAMPLSGDPAMWEGLKKPSSEWRFHRDILNARPDVEAIVHTHATHCTALAMTRRDIPAAHYMIALFGGPTIRCAPYARFGSQDLSDVALEALKDRRACLLANHGMIVVGPTLSRAMFLSVELETLARQYLLTLQIGGVHVLTDEQIAETAEAMASRGYGQA